ncbi:Arsenical-resistance protein Acr3 [Methanimicrococcus sp. At1]|uniref:Arsenical-resistance protein Acr3 n=1 Tax=Methanimicrococcus hacksteinii TaxID=3028293 RepID=A0ABU3VR71_9EURY|nr:bile acid:sodium symporter [Methanimicrococcus sp. At1]MDV0445405.1 Arsenical-resistance protein Acr3 [Methanimicrococcus sp. At1]
MIMLFGVFLQVDLTGLKNSFKNTRFASLTVLINFIWTPLFAWFLASVFLRGEPDLQIGFLMLMVTPCTDWYLLFTDMAKGNVSLGAAQLPLNLILQIILLPVYLLIFAGSVVDIEAITLLKSILIVLLIPFALANIFRYFYVKKYGEKGLEDKILIHNDNMQFVFLNLAIIAMFASQGRLLLQNPELLLIMLIPVVLFFAVNFIGVQLVGRTLGMSYEDTTALNLTTLARNSPLSLAIAVSAFPGHPMIALVLVIGPLIELPILTIIARVLLWIRPKYKTFGKKEKMKCESKM